jgi:NAD(P)-dependent dehydrogenase (short-subunit alcohol dehydrogenase family)
MPTGLQRFSLEGRVAIVTGGGSGLGFGIACAIIAAGARVAITGRREDTLREAAAASGASYYVHDVADDAAAGFVQRVQEDLGPVSILVNNAGNHLKKPAIDTSDDEFRAVIDTHVTGGFRLSRAVLPGMLRSGKGSILFIASMASFLGIPQVAAYSAAKSALVGLVRSLAAEVSPGGVRVNAIAPGWIETPMLRRAIAGDGERRKKILSRTPMGRFGLASEVGDAAVYLCSDAASFVNGVVLPVDGGGSIGF